MEGLADTQMATRTVAAADTVLQLTATVEVADTAAEALVELEAIGCQILELD